ncbi:MBL fold metallo-hydrolase [Cellulomonas dongxiuzhuiae]|uniref:MBL fold metallo-hydrolase n=1 Tax=Cellulomonas dongxiuzhuiae TaxID=2819979 RepID=A0ABX8GN48_9CELL|nr:MBL fold metallo-hydrolase [Cellulomonas dongxiuzhuiae]MBO3096143.1 MBL fold metallo-hydrolase [Cellulomonas dongxiuzhuiae]QWC17410.1 MBL fold metallo-hydrolase [Cellulomonas dongxiuzhuiae]
MSAQVRWLGHATVVLDVGGVRIVTDPLLRRHAGVLRRRGGRAPSAWGWHRADAVLVSHLHHDHAEVGSLRMLGAVPVLAAPSSASWLVRQGLRGVGLAPGEWRTVRGRAGGAAQVRTVPAEHGHRPMPHRPNAATGFVVRGGGLTVWFAGDTGPFPGLARVPELAGAPIDLALVPVGGWGPRLSGGHLDPVEAARVCALVGARVAVPVHWGTLHAPASRRLPPGWMDRAGTAFEAAVRRVAPGVRACVLRPGEAVTVAPGDDAPDA